MPKRKRSLHPDLNSAAMPAARKTRKVASRSKSVGRRRVATKKRVRRAVRKFGKRKRARKSIGGLTRLKILNALAVNNFYNWQGVDTIFVPPSDALNGFRRSVFTVNTTSVSSAPFLPSASYPFGSKDPVFLANIAFIIDGTINKAIKFDICSYFMEHTLQNQSNCDVTVKAHLIECRRDLPVLPPWSSSIEAILGQGFRSAGLDPNTSDNASVNAIYNVRTTLFQSNLFVSAFKVQKTVTKVIKPGMQAYFRLVDKGFRVFPNFFLNMQNISTYASATPTLEWQRGERFYLFEATTRELPVVTATPTVVAVPPLKLTMLSTARWSYRFVNDSIININNVSRGNIGNGGLPCQTMNDQTGAVSNIVNA